MDLLPTWWICLSSINIIIAIVGILGNIFILIVLSQRHMIKSTFNKLRVALAVFDSLFLTVSLLLEVIRLSDKHASATAYSYFLWPMESFAETAVVFMTAMIAIERFIAVTKPHEYNKKKQYRARKIVFSVTLCAVILNAS